MSMSVCLSVCACLSVMISLELHVWSSPNFLYMLRMAVAQSSSGGVMISYIFPVLWMTSHLHISWCCSTLLPGWGSEAHTYAASSLAHRNTRCRQPQWACWTFMTSCLHMFVPVNIATRKWCVLKVTPQMATLQVEFADYDCHVERCRSNNKVTCKHTTNHWKIAQTQNTILKNKLKYRNAQTHTHTHV